jgi:hypothetical protein
MAIKTRQVKFYIEAVLLVSTIGMTVPMKTSALPVIEVQRSDRIIPDINQPPLKICSTDEDIKGILGQLKGRCVSCSNQTQQAEARVLDSSNDNVGFEIKKLFFNWKTGESRPLSTLSSEDVYNNFKRLLGIQSEQVSLGGYAMNESAPKHSQKPQTGVPEDGRQEDEPPPYIADDNEDPPPYTPIDEDPPPYPPKPSAINALQPGPQRPGDAKRCCVFVYADAYSGPYVYKPEEGDLFHRHANAFIWPLQGKFSCEKPVINCRLNANQDPWSIGECYDRDRPMITFTNLKSALQKNSCWDWMRMVTLNHANGSMGVTLCKAMIESIPDEVNQNVTVIFLGCSSFQKSREICNLNSELVDKLKNRCDKNGKKGEKYVFVGNTVDNRFNSADALAWERPDGGWKNNDDFVRKIITTDKGFIVCRIINRKWVPDPDYCPRARHNLTHTKDVCELAA